MQFLEVGPELGNNYTEVIAPQDVATYGGLCALASFDRAELKAIIQFSFCSLVILLLKLHDIITMQLADSDDFVWQSKVIDNINFRNFLELVPEIRELIHDFYTR